MTPADLYFLSRKLRALAETSQRETSALPMAQALVLEEAVHKPGISVGEIAALHGMAQSLVSTAVMELVDKGMLTASPDAGDRRRTSLVATSAAKISTPRANALEGALAKLSARDRKTAQTGVALLLRALGR